MDEWSDIFSFSTSWNVSRHISGKEMIEEIIDLGFNKVELNYQVTEKMSAEILPMVEKGIITVTSVHNVFPRTENPDFSTDSIFLSNTDPEKRKSAVNVTVRTVDMAYLFGSRAVVLHTSEIPVPVKYDDILKELFKQGKRNTAEYNKVKDEFVSYRKSVSRKYVELTRQSLEEICNHMEKKGYSIILGIENRFRCHQIPDFCEAEYLLEKLNHLPVYFWYDIGHAIVQDALGIIENPGGAYGLKYRLFGVHIHDVVDFQDHRCPYASGNEYDKYIEFIKEASLKVFEISKRESKENIINSAKLLYGKVNSFEAN
ncbi:MAG: TIM barrel protein [Clostridiaceae bacterium]|nr:TIM barrel protein [Clostridiaceae bacterium]